MYTMPLTVYDAYDAGKGGKCYEIKLGKGMELF